MASRDETVQAPCSTCNNFDLEEFYQEVQTRKAGIKLKVSSGEVRRRVRAGCRGCTIFEFLLEPVMQESNNETIGIRSIRSISAGWFTMRLKYSKLVLWYSIDILKDNCPSEYALRPISGDTGSEKAIETARLWLETCKAEHTCQRTGIGKIPQRIVKIDTPNVVKLYVSQGERAEYACLSHCWGNQFSNPVLRTTQSSFEKFQDRIPWEDIPETFRDAIYLCYKLGVQYLWIDSLCIIQDSMEDWRDQGSMMAGIYESAQFTIAATRAKNSSEGLFARSGPEYVSRYMTVASLSHGRPPYTIHIRKKLPHSTNYPLLQRGWAFQESKLSCRTFSFGNDELLWHCKSEHKCECGWTGRYSTELDGQKKIDFNGLTTVEQCEVEWGKIVEEYSRKDLTFSKDIFPALQGLAKRFTPVLGRYFAGLWENTLAGSLSWYVPASCDSSVRPREWRAPTWSWASVCGNVEYPDAQKLKQPLVTVVSVETAPVGEDETGEIHRGLLVLRGKCVLGTTSIRRGDKDRIYVRIPSSVGDDLIEYDYIYADYGRNSPNSLWVPDGTAVLLVKVNKHEYEDVTTHYWLILHEVDRKKHLYERIGLVKNWTYPRRILTNVERCEIAQEMTVNII